MDYSKKPGQKLEVFGEIKNKEKPTISIITPFYNGGKTLMETANAVFNQTYPYFEWIIVDDGSKDEDSLKELAKLEKMDDRIRVFHKENGGPSIARDFGISKASKDTKYIFFLDCDDIPEKTMIEVLYWTLETHEEASFAYTTMVNFGDREFIWEQWLTVDREKAENVICISSMVRKEDLLEVGCFGLKEKGMYEDWNLWLKLIKAGKKPLRVNDKLFWYRVSSTGEFSRANKNKKKAMKYVDETANSITANVEVIQFPREGDKYAKTQDTSKLITPKYKRKDNRKNLLFIFPWAVVGGADLFNLELLRRLDKEKYNSTILFTTPNINNLRQEFQLESETLYDLSTFLERPDYVAFTDYIMESRNIDMVIISNTQYGYYMTPYLKTKYPNVPFIDYIHSIDSADPRRGFGRCSIDVDKYLTSTYCCNNFTKNQLINDFGKKNVETLYIGTDEEKYNPKKYNKEELKEKYELPKDKKIISFIARLSDEKRPTMFVRIAKKIHDKNPNTFFVIAGDGYLMKKVRNKVDENFKLLGMVKETDEVYAFSDLTINCSSLEGLALTSYESLAMEVPVISTDVGGQTELIDDTVGGTVHYNGRVKDEVFEKEIDEYVDKALKALKNLDALKKNCRKKILEGFTLNHMVKKFSKIIDDSIEKEKNKNKKEELDYTTYELACESLHKPYFYFTKNYIVNTYGVAYEENRKFKKKAKGKFRTLIYRKYATQEANIILDFLRAIKRTLKEFIIMMKFFIKSIPAFFKLIYKLIVK